jgi:hypothetical protein
MRRSTLRIVVLVAAIAASPAWAETCTVSVSENACVGDTRSDGSNGEDVPARSIDSSGLGMLYRDVAGDTIHHADGGNVDGTAVVRMDVESNSGDFHDGYGYIAAGGSAQFQDPHASPGARNGGNGPDIDAVVTGLGPGTVEVNSYGGNTAGGLHGEGVPGNGGDIKAQIDGFFNGALISSSGGAGDPFEAGGHGGDAGNVTVDLAGTIDTVGVYSQSLNPDGGIPGSTGTVMVVVHGQVQTLLVGSGTPSSCAGACTPSVNAKVIVRMKDGASVGQIDNVMAAPGTLRFAFTTKSASDAKAFKAALAAQGSIGTVSFDGHTYSWSGFDNLMDMIKVLRAKSSSEDVVVTVAQAGTMTCSATALRVIIKQGHKLLTAKSGTSWIELGEIKGSSFAPVYSAGWKVLGAGTFAVTDPSGELIGICS